jgi:hypothetical protein
MSALRPAMCGQFPAQYREIFKVESDSDIDVAGVAIRCRKIYLEGDGPNPKPAEEMQEA